MADGLAPPPLAVAGYELSPQGDGLTYFFPALPASTGGIICVAAGANATAFLVGAYGAVLNISDPACASISLPNEYGGSRRSLLGVSAPFRLNLNRAVAGSSQPSATSPSTYMLILPPNGSAPGPPRSELEPSVHRRRGTDNHIAVFAVIIPGGVGLVLVMMLATRAAPQGAPRVGGKLRL
jgi:hypothetical protein